MNENIVVLGAEQVNVVLGIAENAPALVAKFMGVNEQEVLIALKKLQVAHLPPNPKKPNEKLSLPESYKEFKKLTAHQITTVDKFWSALTDEVRSAVLSLARTNHSLIVALQDNEKSRADNTTKHDLVRLLHLRFYPGANSAWVSVLGVKNRQELDAANSHASVEDAAQLNGYNELADLFNNRSPNTANYTNDFQPENLSWQIVDGIMVPRDTVNQDIMNCLYDLDPNERARPLRDGVWIKKKYGELRSEISKCFSRYMSSGHQKGSIDFVEGKVCWCFEYAHLFSQVVQYAVLLMSLADMKSLGKEIAPEDGGRDTGVLNSAHVTPSANSAQMDMSSKDARNSRSRSAAAASPTPKSLQRREQRLKKKASKLDFSTADGSPNMMSSDDERDTSLNESLVAASESASKREMELDALKFLANKTPHNKKQKRVATKAYNKITAMANLGDISDHSSDDEDVAESED